MASNPPSSCCYQGVRHEGEPTGVSTKIENIEAYIAEPKGKTVHEKAALIYITDILGIWQNAQLIADQYAANGFYTVIPDIFNGDALAPNQVGEIDLKVWAAEGTDGKNPHTTLETDPIIEKTISWLKAKGYTKIGAVGYCWGAKYVTRFLAEGKGLHVGYVAHPSFVDEEELKAIKGPYSISAAETDSIFTTEKRHLSETILQGTKQPYQINLFSGVSHGFSVRCDLSDPVQKFAKEQAFLQATTWFKFHLL